MGVQDMEFEEFVDFDNDVAVCGELTDADILAWFNLHILKMKKQEMKRRVIVLNRQQKQLTS